MAGGAAKALFAAQQPGEGQGFRSFDEAAGAPHRRIPDFPEGGVIIVARRQKFRFGDFVRLQQLSFGLGAQCWPLRWEIGAQGSALVGAAVFRPGIA